MRKIFQASARFINSKGGIALISACLGGFGGTCITKLVDFEIQERSLRAASAERAWRERLNSRDAFVKRHNDATLEALTTVGVIRAGCNAAIDADSSVFADASVSVDEISALKQQRVALREQYNQASNRWDIDKGRVAYLLSDYPLSSTRVALSWIRVEAAVSSLQQCVHDRVFARKSRRPLPECDSADHESTTATHALVSASRTARDTAQIRWVDDATTPQQRNTTHDSEQPKQLSRF